MLNLLKTHSTVNADGDVHIGGRLKNKPFAKDNDMATKRDYYEVLGVDRNASGMI